MCRGPGGDGISRSAGARVVVVPVEAAVLAALAAAAAAPPAGAMVAAPVAAAAARAPRLSTRLALAAAQFLLGCAAAGLGFFSTMLLLGKACSPTDAKVVAGLRNASELLLLVASAQVLVAIMVLLVPARAARPVAVFGCSLAYLTVIRGADVLWRLLSFHNRADASATHGFYLFLYFVVMAVVVSELNKASSSPSFE